MDIRQLIRQRFTQAIAKSYQPCPLIGPSWFRFRPASEPTSFQFTGCQKLAKALCRTPARVAQKIVANLCLDGIAADVKITEDDKIILNFKPGGQTDGPSSSA